MSLSLLWLLLFLAAPALGDTRDGGGCGVPVPPNNTVPVKQGTRVAILRFQTYGAETAEYTMAVAKLPDGYVVWLPYNAVNYETQRTMRAVHASVLCNHYKPHMVANLPNSGGTTPGVVALAGIALLTSGSLLLRRIV